MGISAAGMLLVAALAAPSSGAADPKPGEPGYSIAKTFVAIVRQNKEVDIGTLSGAFGLPELLNGALTWHGPFAGYEEPSFSAFYDPPNSAVGITKIVITWNVGPMTRLNDKPAVSLGLSIFLRPDACPSEAEMVAATGVPLSKGMFPSPHGRPPHPRQWFAMPDGTGHAKNIGYSP